MPRLNLLAKYHPGPRSGTHSQNNAATHKNRAKKWLALICLIPFFFTLVTLTSLTPIPENFHTIYSDAHAIQLLDRHGEPLNTRYLNRWNMHDITPLHDIPKFLLHAFITAEDKRFYDHHGVDWKARFAAAYSNLKAGRAIRGASTITEQVVRMIHPRPRSLWSRWLEGFEATRLEKQYSKAEILEFYLHQVPYAANRRGITQAARYYFDRSLDTLSQDEMLALAVLVRSPSRLDLFQHPGRIDASLNRLRTNMDLPSKHTPSFALKKAQLPIHAPHFTAYLRTQPNLHHYGWPKLHSTLDGGLQQDVQQLLNERISELKAKQLHNGAVIVADHRSGDILAWAVAGDEDTPGHRINAALTPRQPGSTFKPFLYALALEKGWSAATLIDDAPLTELVGQGLHSYHNYSRQFYGPVTLRQALGNSLNIPAVKTLQFVGADQYLTTLDQLGFDNLRAHPNFYGDGIALGNGEVSLLSMVTAYSCLANRGVHKPLRLFLNQEQGITQRIFSEETVSLISNILSDPRARQLEFGHYSVLNFPTQTAVKTGTSSDYHDAWAIGYNYRYTVGIWLGNLDRSPTHGITGSTGPALLLRSIFHRLTHHEKTQPLYLSPKLIKREIAGKTEWFAPGTDAQLAKKKTTASIRFRTPSNHLHIAYDPRLPASEQIFQFHIQGVKPTDKIIWHINNEKKISQGPHYPWQISRGKHKLSAEIWREGEQLMSLKQVRFLVK